MEDSFLSRFCFRQPIDVEKKFVGDRLLIRVDVPEEPGLFGFGKVVVNDDRDAERTSRVVKPIYAVLPVQNQEGAWVFLEAHCASCARISELCLGLRGK